VPARTCLLCLTRTCLACSRRLLYSSRHSRHAWLLSLRALLNAVDSACATIAWLRWVAALTRLNVPASAYLGFCVGSNDTGGEKKSERCACVGYSVAVSYLYGASAVYERTLFSYGAILGKVSCMA